MISLKSLWGFRRKWTRHDSILSIGGIFYMMIGIGYSIEREGSNRQMALQALLRIAPMEFWGGVFIFCGALALISSRWPPIAETWGYVVLTGISMAWGTAYLTGVLLTKAPWANVGGFLVWSLIGCLWWSISGLRNPEPAGSG